ncbi:arginine/serine-rich protein 1 [Cheilinus undulatus]|uniref:arginine/serine-rich protein 1 n=1 Tax=Cheilinus undulatus TaxID=241271 RepID=UPI001BD28C84|nr:arginine/serine-rich protein 1 [Cheilinus undulatus]
MAKEKDSHAEMAYARKTDGINVIFDKNSPASSRSRCGSSTSCESDCSSDSGHYREHGSKRRGHYRSSSSSSSTSSSSNRSSRSRSRSHPRCHRQSSRCGCGGHPRYGRSRYLRSPPRRYRARSRSYSRSPSPDRYSHRHQRSHSRSVNSWSRYSRAASRSSQASSRTYRSQSSSTSPVHSSRLSLNDKRELLKAARENAMKILGVEILDLPDSVKPILPEQSESKPEPDPRVMQHPKKIILQSSEEEPDDPPSLKLSPKGKISFSINNSVVKPTVAVPPVAKVTPRMDSYESRKPYGHWVPVKTGRTSSSRNHSFATSH